MVIMNMILISMGVFFAVLESVSMLFDIVKNIKHPLQFMRGTIVRAREKLTNPLERKVYYGTILLLLTTQGVMFVNMAIATRGNEMYSISKILIVATLMYLYISLRNIVLVHYAMPQKVIDFALKNIAVDTMIMILVNIGQLICVGTLVYSLYAGLQVNVLFT